MDQVLDFATDRWRERGLSQAAYWLILAWWSTLQLTPCDLLELSISRSKLREALKFLQSLAAGLLELLLEAFPEAQAPVRLPLAA